MAKTDNLILKESSGSIGRIMTITKKKSGAILIGKHWGTSAVQPPGKQVQGRFKDGIVYGKAVIANPAPKALYAASVKRDQPAYNPGLRDALKAPEITRISTDLYTGVVRNFLSDKKLFLRVITCLKRRPLVKHYGGCKF